MKQRIEFIDLAKGVCIIWVILWHIQIVPDYIPGLNSVRMPLYFILSGLFFKTCGSFSRFLNKKCQKILVPFVFWYLVGYMMYYPAAMLVPHLFKDENFSIFNVFGTQYIYFNQPIWFLLCLFWVNILFCLIHIAFRSEIWRTVAVMFLTITGVVMSKYRIELPMLLSTSLTALPFYWVGYKLKESGLLYANKYDKYNLWIALAFYVVAFAIDKGFGNPRILIRGNYILGNYLLAFTVSVAGVMSVMYLCKFVKYMPFISYMGRYSIIPLCVHNLIQRPAHIILGWCHLPEYLSGLAMALLVVGLSAACIPICRRWLPMVTAQKDLTLRCLK